MAGLLDSYKKIYENKKAHIGILILSLIWSVLSIIWDIKSGTINNYRQNPIDLIFNILIGGYSIHFLHNAINNIDNGILPSLKNLSYKTYFGMITLNIVWGLYACLCIIAAVLVYILTHFMFLPIIILIGLFFIASFVYYIFLAFAENLETKKLYNIKLIFAFIKPTIKPLYLKLSLFILFNIVIAAIYILIYTLAGLIGLDKIGQIANETYIMDIIMNTLAGYFVIITWYFAYPYALINSYKEYIRPLIRKDENNGTNA